MRSKKLLIGCIVATLAIASMAGYLIFSMNIPPVVEDDDVTSEEIDELLDYLEALDDIESELELDDWDLDIYFD